MGWRIGLAGVRNPFGLGRIVSLAAPAGAALSVTGVARSDGSWWVVEAEGFEGATQARSLEEVPAMLQDFVAVSRGVRPCDVRIASVVIHPHAD